jgi:hypothetical protein
VRRTYGGAWDECSMAQLHDAFENGKRISPKLPEGKKNFLIDIDGTICEDIPNEEPERMEDAAIFEDALGDLQRLVR